MDTIMPVVAVVALFFMLHVTLRLAALERQAAALSRLEAKLDAILSHSGVQFDPYEYVLSGVAEALKSGKKIEAIKRYRAGTGADLKAAKDFVEELQRRASSSA